MIGAHVEQLALAIDALALKAKGPRDLARLIRADFPDEPVRTLRHAIFYAITDPARSDGEAMLRLQGAAIALKNAHDLHAGPWNVQAHECCGGTRDERQERKEGQDSPQGL